MAWASAGSSFSPTDPENSGSRAEIAPVADGVFLTDLTYDALERIVMLARTVQFEVGGSFFN